MEETNVSGLIVRRMGQVNRRLREKGEPFEVRSQYVPEVSLTLSLADSGHGILASSECVLIFDVSLLADAELGPAAFLEGLLFAIDRSLPRLAFEGLAKRVQRLWKAFLVAGPDDISGDLASANALLLRKGYLCELRARYSERDDGGVNMVLVEGDDERNNRLAEYEITGEDVSHEAFGDRAFVAGFVERVQQEYPPHSAFRSVAEGHKKSASLPRVGLDSRDVEGILRASSFGALLRAYNLHDVAATSAVGELRRLIEIEMTKRVPRRPSLVRIGTTTSADEKLDQLAADSLKAAESAADEKLEGAWLVARSTTGGKTHDASASRGMSRLGHGRSPCGFVYMREGVVEGSKDDVTCERCRASMGNVDTAAASKEDERPWLKGRCMLVTVGGKGHLTANGVTLRHPLVRTRCGLDLRNNVQVTLGTLVEVTCLECQARWIEDTKDRLRDEAMTAPPLSPEQVPDAIDKVLSAPPLFPSTETQIASAALTLWMALSQHRERLFSLKFGQGASEALKALEDELRASGRIPPTTKHDAPASRPDAYDASRRLLRSLKEHTSPRDLHPEVNLAMAQLEEDVGSQGMVDPHGDAYPMLRELVEALEGRHVTRDSARRVDELQKAARRLLEQPATVRRHALSLQLEALVMAIAKDHGVTYLAGGLGSATSGRRYSHETLCLARGAQDQLSGALDPDDVKDPPTEPESQPRPATSADAFAVLHALVLALGDSAPSVSRDVERQRHLERVLHTARRIVGDPRANRRTVYLDDPEAPSRAWLFTALDQLVESLLRDNPNHVLATSFDGELVCSRRTFDLARDAQALIAEVRVVSEPTKEDLSVAWAPSPLLKQDEPMLPRTEDPE